MGALDQFAKDTLAAETATVTRGAVGWQLPPEVGMHQVHLDGLFRVFKHAPLLELAAPWSLFGQASEVVLEVKMQTDKLDLVGFDRAMLRRLARQVQRREDKNDRFDGEEPLLFVAARVPDVIRERRTLTPAAPGCYQVGPEWLATTWVAANELPLVDELIPFLIARSGAALDEFARWVKTRRPLGWLIHMLECLPMSTAAAEELRFHALEQTNDPDVRARQQMILKWTLEALPDERKKIVDEGIEKGQLEQARAAVRDVLEARGFTLQAEEAARVEGCTSVKTLERWHKQAIVAATVAEALRLD